MTACVVIAGGGTGGHVFPGLAVASRLQERGVEVRWLGARRGLEAKLVAEHDLPLTLVDIEGVHARRPAAAVRALGLMPRAVAASLKVMLVTDPVAVLGVGGYASAAGLLAGGLLGVPCVLQEQNSIPGWTNRMLAPWADLICCGFADGVARFPSLPAEWTGNPVREEFFEVPEVRPQTPPRLLVLGGSQGSLYLNRTLPRALQLLKRRGIEPSVVHQAGSRWVDVVRTSYADVRIDVTVASFLDAPWEQMIGADLVVARAGALTVSELAAAGRGAVLIPFAAAAGNHQEYNARSLEKAGGARVLLEGEATPERIADLLTALFADPNGIAAMGQRARSVALPGAAERIASRLLAVGGVP